MNLARCGICETLPGGMLLQPSLNQPAPLPLVPLPLAPRRCPAKQLRRRLAKVYEPALRRRVERVHQASQLGGVHAVVASWGRENVCVCVSVCVCVCVCERESVACVPCVRAYSCVCLRVCVFVNASCKRVQLMKKYGTARLLHR